MEGPTVVKGTFGENNNIMKTEVTTKLLSIKEDEEFPALYRSSEGTLIIVTHENDSEYGKDYYTGVAIKGSECCQWRSSHWCKNAFSRVTGEEITIKITT